MNEENYSIEEMEDQKEMQDSQSDAMEQSSWIEHTKDDGGDGLFKLFGKVLKTGDSTKVGNVSPVELGVPRMTVRGAKFAARVGDLCGNEPFAIWFRGYAEDILSSSASRKGWMAELFVSQKKNSVRGSNLIGQDRTKWSMFGSNKGGQDEGGI